MNYTLRNMLSLSEKEINNSKIELNMTKGRDGECFIDIWLKKSKRDKEKGKCLDCCYWPRYGKAQNNFKVGQNVFSFVRIGNDNWLFVSAGKVLNIPNKGRPKIKILNKFVPLFGRLVINLKKGNKYSRISFNLSKFIDDAVVNEVFPVIYDGEVFNGYDNICLPYSKLADIFNRKISPTYYAALNKITGIYCLTDTKNGKLYIGSASGEGGVAQRWGNYFDTKHGGNKKLKALYKKKGEKYFEKYFKYSLIEYFGLSYDPEKLKAREQYWKRVFGTIKNGYNDN